MKGIAQIKIQIVYSMAVSAVRSVKRDIELMQQEYVSMLMNTAGILALKDIVITVIGCTF